MDLNAGKCHFMRFGKDTGNETCFQKSSNEGQERTKSTWVTIDTNLAFKIHIRNLCKEAL